MEERIEQASWFRNNNNNKKVTQKEKQQEIKTMCKLLSYK